MSEGDDILRGSKHNDEDMIPPDIAFVEVISKKQKTSLIIVSVLQFLVPPLAWAFTCFLAPIRQIVKKYYYISVSVSIVYALLTVTAICVGFISQITDINL